MFVCHCFALLGFTGSMLCTVGYSQQAQDVDKTLLYCWPTVYNAGPSFNQCCINMLSLLRFPANNGWLDWTLACHVMCCDWLFTCHVSVPGRVAESVRMSTNSWYPVWYRVPAEPQRRHHELSLKTIANIRMPGLFENKNTYNFAGCGTRFPLCSITG